MNCEDLLDFQGEIQIADVGASAIREVPVYKHLLDKGLGFLYAFEGDERQIDRIKATYGDRVRVLSQFLFNGTEQTLYVADAMSGMTSLLKPRVEALQFFSGFAHFAHGYQTEKVATKRLDDLKEVPRIDFLKMDIQGSELTVLAHGQVKLEGCLAIQLETSFVCLYENQPTFGEVDVWMRAHGFVPHCYLSLKRWTIAPTIFNGDFRVPGNQLLESDIVYVRDPLRLELLDDRQLKVFCLLAHYCFKSYDMCVHLILELVRRKSMIEHSHERYQELLNAT